MEWIEEFLRLSKCLLFNIHIGVDEEGCEVLGENQSCVGIKKLRGILNMSCGERVKINKGPFIFVTTGDKTYGSMI